MKKLILSLVLISSLVSCNNDTEETVNFYIDNNFDLLVESSDGTDLLDPSNSNSYNQKNLSIYYILNGEKKQTDYSIVLLENGETKQYALRVMQYNYASSDVITYIKWDETNTDVIKTNYKSGNNYVVCSKISYNDEVVYDQDNGIYATSPFGEKKIKVVK